MGRLWGVGVLVLAVALAGCGDDAGDDLTDGGAADGAADDGAVTDGAASDGAAVDDGGFDPRTLPPPSCGDGIAQAALGEVCDDGNDTDGDGCTDCQLDGIPPDCGDGAAEGDEACDDAGFSADCDIDCTRAACGDGVLNTAAGETCDDGNTAPFDGCGPTCTTENLCGDGVCSMADGESCVTCAADCPCGEGEPCVRDGDCGELLRCDESADQCSASGGDGPLLSGLECPVHLVPADPSASFVDHPDGSRSYDGPVLLRTGAMDIPFPASSVTWFPDGTITARTVELPSFEGAGDAFGTSVAFDRELTVVSGVVPGTTVASQLDDDLVPADRSYLQLRILDRSSYGVSVFGPTSSDPSAVSATLDGETVIFEEYIDPCEPLWVVFSATAFGWSTEGNLHVETDQPLWNGTSEATRSVYGHEFRNQPLNLAFFGIPLEIDGTFLLDYDANDDGGLLDPLAIDAILRGELTFAVFDDISDGDDDFGLLTLGATGVSLPVEGALAVETLGESFVLDFDAAGDSAAGALSAEADPSAGTLELLFRGETLNPWADTPLGPWLPENSSILQGYYRTPEDWGVRGERILQFFPAHDGPALDGLIEMRITPTGPTFTATGEVDLGTLDVLGVPVALGSVDMTFDYDFVRQRFCGETSTSGEGSTCLLEICAPLDGDGFDVSASCTGGCRLQSDCAPEWCNPLGICEPGKPNGAFCLNNDAECASGHCEGTRCVECEVDPDCAAIGLPTHQCDATGLEADFRCKEPCTSNGDCTSDGEYCAADGLCDPKLDLDQLCDEGTDCESGFCDGLLGVRVCVECSKNSDCPGTDNRCDSVTFSCYQRCSSDDPDGDAECGAGEFCDGERCQSEIPLGVPGCGRDGHCETEACAEAICQECANDGHCASGEVCDTRLLRYTCEVPCTDDSECAVTEFCDTADGSFCQPDRPFGATCGRDAQCEHERFHCTDRNGDAFETGACRECAVDEHCPDPSTQYCDQRVIGAYQCKARNGLDGDCERDGWCVDGLYCAWPYCQECATDEHCTAPGEVCDNFPGVGTFTCMEACSSDGECAATEYCSIGGLCVPDRVLGGECVRSEQCLEGTYYCSLLNTRCVECLEDSHCGADRCDITSFSCVTACSRDSECDPDEWCDVLFNRCEPDRTQGQSCGRDQQCLDAPEQPLVCANPLMVGGTCQECADDGDCDSGEVCEDRLGIGSFSCERGCTSDSDCTADDPDTYCDLAFGANICVARVGLKDGCPRDAACEEGLRCTSTPANPLDGTCEVCVEDGDCGEGTEYCDYGLARPYTCEPLRGQGAGCRDGQCREPYVCTTELVRTCEECDSDDDCTEPGEVCDDAAFRSFTCMQGCTDDDECDDSTSFCNESAGVCDPDRDIGGACDGDTMCKGACSTVIGGTCVACREDYHCTEPGEICDYDFLGEPTCRPPCTDSSDCASDRYCDGTYCQEDFELGELGCLDDSACLGSLVCTSDGVLPGTCEECATDDDCTAAGEVCDNSAIIGSFTCVAPCSTDADCESRDGWCKGDIRGARCEADYRLGEGPCIPSREGTCLGDLQCNDVFVCVPCDGDEDCAGSDFCDLDPLSPTPYQCVPDLGLTEACNRPSQCESNACTGVPSRCRECDNANGGDAVCESDTPGTHCNANSECVPDLGEGERVCAEHVECAGALLCVGGTCRECATVDGGADAYCEANWGANTHCNASDQCIPDLEEGEVICENDEECAGSLYCNGIVCRECSNNDHCGVNACLIGGTCGCTTDLDCVVGDRYCASGSCTSRKSNGSSCTADTQCASRICNGSTCRECVIETDCPSGEPFCVGYSCVSCLPSTRACVSNGSCCSGSCTFFTCD